MLVGPVNVLSLLVLMFLFEPSFFCAFLSWLSLFLATLYDMSTLICKLSSPFVVDLNLRPCWLKIECVDQIENPQMWHHFTNKIDEISWNVMLDLPYFPPGSTFPETPAHRRRFTPPISAASRRPTGRRRRQQGAWAPEMFCNQKFCVAERYPLNTWELEIQKHIDDIWWHSQHRDI